LLTAPGVVDGTDWLAVTGTVLVGSGATTVRTFGSVAFNLLSGAGLLSSDQSAPVALPGANLPGAAPKLALLNTAYTGRLETVSGVPTGAVTGMGTASVQPATGHPVMADAVVAVTKGGKFVVSFPLDLSLVGAAPPGSVGTVYWASAGVTGFPVGG